MPRKVAPRDAGPGPPGRRGDREGVPHGPRGGEGPPRRHRRGELAGGEQQRVAVARALINRPRLILADEPTGNLDPKTSEVIYDLFLRLQAERGIAFLIATHNHDLARKADRGYRLVEGRARPFEATGATS